jgi:hypothetical protein
VYEVIDRFVQAPPDTSPWRFVGYDGGEAGAGRRGAPRRLASFDGIEADEMLLRRGRDGVVRAQMPFTMLLPTPSADPGTDMYYVTQRRPWRPMGRAVPTDAEARTEAGAIERMLDLLDDDDFARGSTWASFDSRRVLDLCADLVARTLRLQPEHPHRRVTIVGRGDWLGDEAERRAGQRYRGAMRRVLAAGIPVDRIQLMRGAGLGWFQSLTAPAMGEIFEQRRRGGAGKTRLYLSVRQPHTVSILVVGDLDRAQTDGDLRHLRVAMIVEAASVEPDGAEARVRVIRAGLFSARPEILTATSRLLGALREEHRFLVRRQPLADDPRIAAMLGEDGAIEPRGDAGSLTALRENLYRLQLRLWREALRHEVSEEVLVGETARGKWLASVMARTGILDGTSLQGLLLREGPSGTYRVDPDRLDAVLRRPEAFEPSPPIRGRTIPPQPLTSDEVDADALERWIGWKRFLRGAQVIPDTRGKDLDLVFDARGIRVRAAAWLRRARELAQRMPGRVMVVVAGDGMNPSSEQAEEGRELLGAQSAALLDPNLRYLRIQHAEGTTLQWLKGILATLAARPPGQPVGIQWEAAHGASIHVMLVAIRDEDAPDRPWSLDGWSVERCSVLVSDLRGSGVRDTRIGLFAEPLGGPFLQVNQELLGFGRAHCERLLAQGGPRVRGETGAPPPNELEAVIVAQIAGWLERVRGWRTEALVPPPREVEARTRWVAGQLGLCDDWLAEGLAAEMDTTRAALEVARSLWDAVPDWQGTPPYPSTSAASILSR